MESWKIVWRDGFLPSLPTDGLLALAESLRSDDPRIVQGSTTTPPPLMAVQDWPVEEADALAFFGVLEHGGFACTADEHQAAKLGAPVYSNPNAALVGQVEEVWARLCYEADQRLGEPAACRWFLNAWDQMPRDVIFRELLAEVELALRERMTAKEPQPC